MKRQEINFIKACMHLNENICQENKKLYDRQKHLELSHNRKIKTLKKIQELTENYPHLTLHSEYKEKILKLCKDALFSNGRVKWGLK